MSVLHFRDFGGTNHRGIMKTLSSGRGANFLGLLACILLLAYAYYLQYHDNVQPCPLCIFQRMAMVGMGAVFLLATLHNPRRTGGRVYAVLIALAAVIGGALSGRHIWIQAQPEGSVPACGATLDYLMDVFSPGQVIRKVLTGSGECAKVDWTLFGFSMPVWVLGAFVVLGVWGIAVNWKR
jgi:disulfide bond formation protein DsbB